MKYEIKDIVFDGNNKYNPKLYWDLYRIYCAYNDVFKNKSLTSLVTASHLASSTGVLCFNQIINDGLELTKETEELLNYKANLVHIISMTGLGYDFYKDFLNLDSIEKLNKLYEEKDLKEYCEIEPNDSLKELSYYVKEDIEIYLNKIYNFIPKNIYEQIDNKELFSLGFIKERIYNQLKEFYKKLEKWLINPVACDNKYNLDLLDLEELENFHDELFKYKIDNNNFILEANVYKILFSNFKFLYNEIKDNNIIEGYCNYSIKRNNNKLEIFMEFLEGIIILKCNSVNRIDK